MKYINKVLNILGWNSGQLNDFHLLVTWVGGNDQKAPDKIHNDSKNVKKHYILGMKRYLLLFCYFAILEYTVT